jgi:hypothetical protein
MESLLSFLFFFFNKYLKPSLFRIVMLLRNIGTEIVLAEMKKRLICCNLECSDKKNNPFIVVFMEKAFLNKSFLEI